MANESKSFLVQNADGELEEVPITEEPRNAYFIGKFNQGTIAEFSTEVLTGVSILSVDVVEDSKIMDNPVESGILISDHRIKNPITITVRCTLPEAIWKNTYLELRSFYEQRGTNFLTIKTKADVYKNMQLIGLPHKETPEDGSRIFFDLHFRSIIFVIPSYVNMPEEKVQVPAGATTIDAGQQEATLEAYRQRTQQQGQ